MSMSIYNPYFYIIQHISSGRYYAGVKYAKDSNPDNLLKFNGYQTSSDIIKQIILEEGLEAFIIRKIKIFETAEKALAYELRFLKRVNAAFNDSFLNRSNNSFGTLNVDYEKTKQTCLDRYGYENVLQSKAVKEKIKQTHLNNRGVENPMQSEEAKEKKRQTCLERYDAENTFQSEEIKEKIKQICLEKYGVEHPMKSEEVKENKKQTCLENYGFDNPMKSEAVKEKRRQTCITLKNRPIVLEIRKYVDRFKLRLGSGWFFKKQEFLDNMFLELKIIYGALN